MKTLFAGLAFLGIVVVSFSADRTQVKLTGAGYQLGTTTNQALGFLGATPIVTPAGPAAQTNTMVESVLTVNTSSGTPTQAVVTLSSATILSNIVLNLSYQTITDLNSVVVAVVTGVTATLSTAPALVDVTINTVHGYTAAPPAVVVTNATATSLFGFSTAAKGSNTTSALNALRQILVNFGLMK